MVKYWRATRPLRRALHAPGDIVLAARIFSFALQAPRALERTDVAGYLESVRRAPRPRAADLASARARIVRLRDGVLALPYLWRRSNCYVRSLVLLRFLDAGDGDLRMHVGIEERERRLHGHAWVTLDRALVEGPEGVLLERLREVPISARR